MLKQTVSSGLFTNHPLAVTVSFFKNLLPNENTVNTLKHLEQSEQNNPSPTWVTPP